MKRYFSISAALLCCALLTPSISLAAKKYTLCLGKDGLSVVIRKRCRKNETKLSLTELKGNAGPQGTQGVQGVQGPKGDRGAQGQQGTAGSDGQLRVYGDGSAGAKIITGTNDLSGSGSGKEKLFQFTDFTVNAGQSLYVPTGTVIRCTGSFINNGSIEVMPSTYGGKLGFRPQTVAGFSKTPQIIRMALPGLAGEPALNGSAGDASIERLGGLGGVRVDQTTARQILNPGHLGGGGGGAAARPSLAIANGSPGAGTFVVLCQGPVVNNGTIVSDGFVGAFGGGGGAGGVVILASKNSVTNSAVGVIQANGGRGYDSTSDSGANGGGGGGIIHLIAPIVSNSGTINVAGGTGGSGGTATVIPWGGGGGGGACGGSGGNGADVQITGNTAKAGDGTAGYIFTTEADPTALF